MEIEIAYADADTQLLLNLNVPEFTTIEQAIKMAELSIDVSAVGIFGKLRSLDWQVKAGDRIEIYRPLRVNPMEARLERAKVQRQKKLFATKNKQGHTSEQF